MRCLEIGSLITLPGHGHRMEARLHRCRHPGTLSRCPLTPLRPPSREKAPSLVLRGDRSVFGVVCREVCYLPVIHQLAGLGGPEQMLGTEHRLWLTRGTLYNTALICRDDPEVLQCVSVTHRKQAQIDGRPCQRSPKQQVAERWLAPRLAEPWPVLVNLPHLHKQLGPWRLEKYPAPINAFFFLNKIK